MTKHENPEPKFAICINTDDPDLLTPRMIYEVLPDKTAAKSNYIRIIDNEGEDYLYPADYFIVADFSHVVEEALSRISLPIAQQTPVGSDNLG